MRLRDFDYSIPGAYFITICTHNKTAMLSHVVGAIHESPVIKLTPYGEITDEIISNIPARFAVVVDQYVIMPNHIHLILAITDDSQMRAIRDSPLRSRSVISKIVGYLKMNVSKEIHQQNENAPYGNADFTTTSSATDGITRNTSNIFAKIPPNGISIRYTYKSARAIAWVE